MRLKAFSSLNQATFVSLMQSSYQCVAHIPGSVVVLRSCFQQLVAVGKEGKWQTSLRSSDALTPHHRRDISHARTTRRCNKQHLRTVLIQWCLLPSSLRAKVKQDSSLLKRERASPLQASEKGKGKGSRREGRFRPVQSRATIMASQEQQEHGGQEQQQVTTVQVRFPCLA